MIFKLNRPKSTADAKGKIFSTVPLLPLRDIVVFPHMVVPLFIGRERSILALENAMSQESPVLLSAQKDARKDDPGEPDIYRFGTVGQVLQLLRLPDGTVKALIEGKGRATIRQYLPNANFYLVEIEEIIEPYEYSVEAEALIRTAVAAFENYAKLNKKIPQEVLQAVGSIEEPGRLADNLAAHLNIKIDEKQQLLEVINPLKRLDKVLTLIQR